MKILLIEDNSIDAEVFTRAVKQWRKAVEVDVVSFFQDAILVCQDYDAVVVDLGLPDAAIYENLDLLNRFSQIPTVVFTGQIDPELSYQIGRRLTGVIFKIPPGECSPEESKRNALLLVCQVTNQIGQVETRNEAEESCKDIEERIQANEELYRELED